METRNGWTFSPTAVSRNWSHINSTSRMERLSTLPNCFGFCRLTVRTSVANRIPLPAARLCADRSIYALHARSVSHRLPMLTRETNRDAPWEGSRETAWANRSLTPHQNYLDDGPLQVHAVQGGNQEVSDTVSSGMEAVLARLMMKGHMTTTCALLTLVPESESGVSSTTFRDVYTARQATCGRRRYFRTLPRPPSLRCGTSYDMVANIGLSKAWASVCLRNGGAPSLPGKA